MRLRPIPRSLSRKSSRLATVARPGSLSPPAPCGAAGCEEETRQRGKTARDQGPGTDGRDRSTLTSSARHQPQAQASAARQSGPIIGQRTTEIRDASTELKQGGARSPRPGSSPKTRSHSTGNAYVSIIGRTSVLKIQQAVDLYHAENDRYPKDFDEFMTEIIKANNIALPMLPPYQEYGYDEKEHKLIILEYQDRKN